MIELQDQMLTAGTKAFEASENQDRDDLARAGKKPALKRQFGFMSMLGFGCIVLSTWEGVLALFAQGFTNGGPAGLVYGFILTWIGTMSIFLTLSELASMAPTSAGQYHWCAMLAPESYKKVSSYITGWLTVCGWQAAVTSSTYLTGSMLQSLIVLNHPEYNPKPWQAMLLMWAGLLVAVFLNTVVSNFLPNIEGAILIFHVVGFFAILIPLTYLAPSHGTASDVFGKFLNNGGWPTQGLSFWVGISSTVFMFLGADSVIHMSEEIHDASVTVPRAIIGSIAINGVLGFGMLMGALFTLGNVDTVLKTDYGFPFIQIFLNSTNSIGGTTTMTAVILALTFFSTIGLVASSSRMTWAFARDRGLPGWRYMSKVESRTSIPVVAILFTAILSILLDLIDLGSSTVLNDIISLTVNSVYGSYLISSALLLWRRCTGGIAPRYSEGTPSKLNWGPWQVPGIFGIINNAYACMWMVLVLFFTSWPPTTPPTASTMNYSIFITIFVALLSVLYYLLWGKKNYTGPIVEVVLPS
ncbi:MAG: hypothetical protein M1818_007391 [Claussenomyces sp. TS43310]|nr:MAG: hypothetical protein M1818_007391 [Claussenomyces sp. TS43310]